MTGVIIWLLLGCVVGFLFFRKMDQMMARSPDKYGNRSIDELLRRQANKNADDHMQTSLNYIVVKTSMLVVTTAVWPIFAVALLWMLTWT